MPPGAGLPFNNHSYVGVTPPFVGVAVKVTDVPLHILTVEPAGAGLEVIVTDTGNDGSTVIVISLLYGAFGNGQLDALEYMRHFTTWPLVSDDVVNVFDAAGAPWETLFTNHS